MSGNGPMDDPFADLGREQRRRAAVLRERFRDLGAEDPEEWARSEVSEDIPQLATFLLLRRLWRDAECWREDPADWFGPGPVEPVPDDPEHPHDPAAQAVARALAAGVSADDLKRIARAVAYDSLFSAVHAIDEGCDPDEAEDLPGWILAEVGPDGQGTGRVVGSMHESLPGLAPPLFPSSPGPDSET
jgi:hypothetical protein